MKIGIFGGAFNPPHLGHIKLAKTAVGQLGLDRLIVVPSGIPPHKSVPDGTPSADDRLYMAKAAFTDIRNAEISEIEIRQIHPCYTIDTVGLIRKDLPDAQIYLLVGTDMFITLDKWKDGEALLKTITPAVFSRKDGDAETIGRYSRSYRERYGVNTEIINNEVFDISSSEIRELLKTREGLGYITDTTYEYIIRNRLYSAKPDFDWLRVCAYKMLDPQRKPHVAGCEEEAMRLAKRWGVDADDAREAAILHDITKKLTLAENTAIFEEHGIKFEALQPGEEKLLHSKSGAILAKAVFGVSDEVGDAIMWHTTGKAGMSVLEKVIYIADYIEPSRDLPGVDALRAAAYENLDQAIIMGLELSIEDMRARGITPNRTTFDALSDLTRSARP